MKLLKAIVEAEKTTLGKTAEINFAEPKSKGSLAPAQPKVKPTEAPKTKIASAAKTREKMSGVNIDPSQVPEMNADELDMSNEISDEEAAAHAGHHTAHHTDTPGHEPKVTTTNLPAVINTALARTSKDVTNIDPEWHMVKHLPGYMSKQIRTLGRKVFEPFTSTPIEQIQVLANLGGGPNTDAEINVVSKHITSHGTKDTTAELEFHKVLPGYSAKIAIYNCDGATFFLVKDFAGGYIYSWPQSDSKHLNGSMPKGIEHTPRSVDHEVAAIEHDRPAPKQLSHDLDWDDMG
jgi:hypothetical protein